MVGVGDVHFDGNTSGFSVQVIHDQILSHNHGVLLTADTNMGIFLRLGAYLQP